jgi:hypothetical protein
MAALFTEALAWGNSGTALYAKLRCWLRRIWLGDRGDRPTAAPTKTPACGQLSPTIRAISFCHHNVPGS